MPKLQYLIPQECSVQLTPIDASVGTDGYIAVHYMRRLACPSKYLLAGNKSSVILITKYLLSIKI